MTYAQESITYILNAPCNIITSRLPRLTFIQPYPTQQNKSLFVCHICKRKAGKQESASMPSPLFVGDARAQGKAEKTHTPLAQWAGGVLRGNLPPPFLCSHYPPLQRPYICIMYYLNISSIFAL